MTDKQKAFDALDAIKNNYTWEFCDGDDKGTCKVCQLLSTIRAALEAKAVDVELLEALKHKAGDLPESFTPRKAGYASGWNDAIDACVRVIARAEAGRGSDG